MQGGKGKILPFNETEKMVDKKVLHISEGSIFEKRFKK